MKTVKRFLGLCAAGLALVLTMGAAPTPALASGTTRYVGVFDALTCNHLSLYASINLASAASGSGDTIAVCPGIYPATAYIDTKTNLTIKGIGVAMIVPPSPGFNGTLFTVYSSTNVTVQGFYVDGNGLIGTTGATGIAFDKSSGTVTGNHVSRIRPFPMNSSNNFIGIETYNDSPTLVKITKNTVTDFQSAGIRASGNGIGSVNAQITHNRIVGGSNGSNVPSGIELDYMTIGLVTSNVLQGNYNASVGSSSTGIYLKESSAVVVKGNKITAFDNGISLYSAGVVGGANNNAISANMINETATPISLFAEDVNPASVTDPQVNFNSITSNKIVNSADNWAAPAEIIVHQDGSTVSVTAHADSNIITGNSFTGYVLTGNLIYDEGLLNITAPNTVKVPPAGG